jgi:hypothetical protein
MVVRRCVLALLLLTAACRASGEGQVVGRAVSLRALQSALVEGPSKQAEALCGMTRVTGFVVDRKGRDIVLVGVADPSFPPLQLQDFVVALRSSWLRYATIKGRVRYYTSPGCSIDPDPGVICRLQELGVKIATNMGPDEARRHVEEWRCIGASPQKVRVMGVPFDSHFARVMVDADYKMKRYVNGTAPRSVPGLLSLSEIIMSVAREDLAAGRRVSVPAHSVSRFWFCPGETSYYESDSAYVLDTCRIVLLTEEEFLSESNILRGCGRPNPLARQFADSFTANLPALVKNDPIFAQLDGLFRFVAIARIMADNNVVSGSGLGLSYLLDRYKLPKTYLARQLPGVVHVAEASVDREVEIGTMTYNLTLPSCGGVSMDVKPKRVLRPRVVVKQGSGSKGAAQPGVVSADASVRKPALLRKIVLSARKSPASLSWDFPADKVSQ